MHKSLALASILAISLQPTAHGQAATSPSTNAVPASSPTTAAVKPVELAGYLSPIDAQELKPKLKRFTSPLTVTQVVAHGDHVRAGEPLIAFDLTELDQQILEATSDLEVAKAGVARAETDSKLGEKGDAATLEERTDAVADAKLNLAWWKNIDGPDFLKRLDQAVQSSQDSIDDQNDELDQLRKMYKSEELTNATADIVVKRAVRGLERSQEAFEVTKHAADKQRATEYPNQQQTVERALASAERALEDAKSTTAQSAVTRAATLLKARIALRDAQKKLSELEQDKQAISDLRAQADGIVYFGAFSKGAWQGADAEAIKAGEKFDPSKPILTVFQPGKMRVVASVDEPNFFTVNEGAVANVKVAALPMATIVGHVGPREPIPEADGTFRQKIDLTGMADARLVPGMKVKVEITPEAK